MTGILAWLLKFFVNWGAAKLGLKLTRDAEYKQAMDAAYAAGRATGIAEEAKRHEAAILSAPPVTSPEQAVPILNELFKGTIAPPVHDARVDLLNGIYRVKP